MPQIRPITDLRNTTEISELCHARREPLFITKNGYGDLVVMSIEAYEEMFETGSTLDKYEVKLYARAYRDMEDIYAYIANNLHDPNAAQNIIDEIENAVFSLELMPERGAVRRSGIYANRDYRQLFVGNYIIVYRVKKEEKQVHIVTVRYAPSSF